MTCPARRSLRPLVALVATAALALVLAGCGAPVATAVVQSAEPTATATPLPPTATPPPTATATAPPPTATTAPPTPTAPPPPPTAAPPTAAPAPPAPAPQPTTSTQPASVPAGWLVYHNDTLGFALAYPPGWRVDESDAAKGVVYVRSPQDNSIWLAISLDGSVQPGVGVDQLRDQFYHDVTQNCDQAGIDATRYNTVAGVTFASLSATCQQGTNLWEYYIGAGLRGGVEWDFQMHALYGQYNTYADQDFSPMLDSLTIYGPPPAQSQ
ncbi:MAG TPA: hypothetical protein VFL91_11595 [Thermomicrobiales bacterium]|nr:hypothetical protein [Thermomicrobiales bacterium]